MRRREFIVLLGGAAAVWARAGNAQQPAPPVIGFLSSSSPGETTRLGAFQRGLEETGFQVGRDVAIAYRYAEGQYGRLPGLLQDLIDRQAAVILASALPAALAAKAAKSAIPIVCHDPARPRRRGDRMSANRGRRGIQPRPALLQCRA
ncbi:MAG TPA: ABC transporter substrate binding protein [Xanthobacteraceae bacterium]